MNRCKRCRKEVEKLKLRRGWCLQCYRIMTGLSGGDRLIVEFQKDIIKIKQRISFMEFKLRELINRQKERVKNG